MEFGKRIAELGLTTMTGGGPGIMEAANRGLLKLADNQLDLIFNYPLNKKKIHTCISLLHLNIFLSEKYCW